MIHGLLDQGHILWVCDHNATQSIVHDRLIYVPPINGVCNADESLPLKTIDFLIFAEGRFTASTFFAADRHLSSAWYVLISAETLAMRQAKVKPQSMLATLQRNEYGILELDRSTVVLLNKRERNKIQYNRNEEYLRAPQPFNAYEHVLMDEREDESTLGMIQRNNRKSTLLAFRQSEKISRL